MSGFSEPILHALRAEGFDRPMAIQAQGWPVAMSGLDLVGIGQTGSGKTLGYLLPAFEHVAHQPPLEAGESGPVALALAPTRELAQQIHAVARRYGRAAPRVRSACLFGGAHRGRQVQDLQRGAHFVVATPGR